jgi:hypothetical protein
VRLFHDWLYEQIEQDEDIAGEKTPAPATQVSA